jgi:hypothetical protein
MCLTFLRYRSETRMQFHGPRTPAGPRLSYCWKEILQSREDRGWKSQGSFCRILNCCDENRNSITEWKQIGNNIKSLALHLNVAG